MHDRRVVDGELEVAHGDARGGLQVVAREEIHAGAISLEKVAVLDALDVGREHPVPRCAVARAEAEAVRLPQCVLEFLGDSTGRIGPFLLHGEIGPLAVHHAERDRRIAARERPVRMPVEADRVAHGGVAVIDLRGRDDVRRLSARDDPWVGRDDDPPGILRGVPHRGLHVESGVGRGQADGEVVDEGVRQSDVVMHELRLEAAVDRVADGVLLDRAETAAGEPARVDPDRIGGVGEPKVGGFARAIVLQGRVDLQDDLPGNGEPRPPRPDPEGQREAGERGEIGVRSVVHRLQLQEERVGVVEIADRLWREGLRVRPHGPVLEEELLGVDVMQRRRVRLGRGGVIAGGDERPAHPERARAGIDEVEAEIPEDLLVRERPCHPRSRRQKTRQDDTPPDPSPLHTLTLLA